MLKPQQPVAFLPLATLPRAPAGGGGGRRRRRRPEEESHCLTLNFSFLVDLTNKVACSLSHSIHLFSSSNSCLSVCGGKYGSIRTRGRSKTKTMFGAAAVPGSRQGCFKCGNLGHIAENCQAPGRLCYNCREPGHESTNCPQPRSTDGKQCYACGGVGHVKSDCPSMRGAFGPGQKCFKCGRPGHLARECTVPGFVGAFRGRGGFGGAFGGRPRPPVNPDGTPVKCYRCNGENHLARDCLAPRDEAAILASKKCYKCQETGHIARDCTKEDVSPAAE
ncbi:uncharacterized protein IAS62_000259 [Cryptococcus decagattii]|uniref:CCHC-type domain-containing protein n=1 Tax=Cryptococcus decagattii TaxID=1859122 RepID=A0ABZ2AKC9_9TREE